MDVAAVRRFNRTVTQRVGALHDHYLSRSRSLGESRALWEIGPDGCDVRDLRVRLDLDSGYLSRLLRSLEDDGLVVIEASPADRRVRTARLTRRGRAERAELDRRSDALATSILEPLSPTQQARLVDAMREVERLLSATLVALVAVDPASPEAQHCLHEYFAELDRRFDAGFDPAVTRSTDLDGYRPPAGLFVVARLHGEAVGCGGLKLHADGRGELKRMWVSPAARGLGLGRRLLVDLEDRARAAGCDRVVLDTNGNLTEAIAMYRKAGYEEIDAFNDEPYADHWFGKALTSSAAVARGPRPAPGGTAGGRSGGG